MPIGFQNLGNTCYISSVLQVLVHLQFFREIVNEPTLNALQETLIKRGKTVLVSDLNGEHKKTTSKLLEPDKSSNSVYKKGTFDK